MALFLLGIFLLVTTGVMCFVFGYYYRTKEDISVKKKMTREEIIKAVKSMKFNANAERNCETDLGRLCDDITRDLMRLEKIEQVLDDYNHDLGPLRMSESHWLQSIYEIMETVGD